MPQPECPMHGLECLNLLMEGKQTRRLRVSTGPLAEILKTISFLHYLIYAAMGSTLRFS